MAKKASKSAVVDTSAGSKAYAYALAVQYRTQVEPRLPQGMIDTLGEDLTTLGAPPAPTQPAASAPAASAAVVSAPTLEQALATAGSLVSGIHEAIAGAKAKSDVRKAYGVSSRGAPTELSAVVAAGEKIVARATANPAEALGLGVLTGDVTALQGALTALGEAEAAAKAKGASTGAATAKAKKAAEVRMHEATARIAGAGVLAFALNAAVRAEFEGLRGKKKG
jgi:hypothetical protein